MGQLKSSEIDGNLTVTGEIVVNDRNVLDEIDELNTNITNLPFSKASMGEVSLSYYSTDWLEGYVTLDKNYSSTAVVLLTIMYKAGAALTKSQYPTLSFEISGNTLTVWASGNFVSGNILTVKYLVLE